MDPPPQKKHAGQKEDGRASPEPIAVVPTPSMIHLNKTHTTRENAPPVSLAKLVEARKSEVLLFEETVRKTSGGTKGGVGHFKRAHQLLPRHLRRRAMSYNPYLVPLRLRQMAIKQSEETEAPAKRSTFWRKRRPVHRQQSKLGQWLETHLWQAKRAKMITFSGYKVAWQSSNRARKPAWRTAKGLTATPGLRAYLPSKNGATSTNSSSTPQPQPTPSPSVRRSDKHALAAYLTPQSTPSATPLPASRTTQQYTSIPLGGALAIDTSCIRAINLSGPGSAFAKLFYALHLDASFLLKTFQIRKLHTVLLNKRLQSESQPLNDLRPIFVPLAPAHIHGRIIPQTGHTNKNSEPMLQYLFWVEPYACNEVLEHLSQLSPSTITVSPFENLTNRFELIGPGAGKILQRVLDPFDPSLAPALRKFLSNRPKAIPPGTIVVAEVSDPRVLRYKHRNAGSAALDPTGVESSSSDANSPFSILSMMSNLVLHGQEDGISSYTSIDQCPLWGDKKPEVCAYHDHQTQDPSLLVQVAQTSKTWVILQRFAEGEDDFEGWIMLLPPTWGKPMWKQVVKSGARPNGLRERFDLSLEALRPRFPYDFPGTAGYQAYIQSHSKELQAAWLRKPPQKRPNFKKLGCYSPFQPDWLALWQSTYGIYQAYAEDKPLVHLAYRFGQDMKQFAAPTPTSLSSSTLFLPLVPVILTLREGGTTIKYNAHVYDMQARETESEAIGFVTSGAFLYERGLCAAIAFVAAPAFHRHIMPGLRVLVRNVTSTEYHVATVELMPNTYG